MGKETRFFTFPVELLQKAFENIAGVCSDAVDYAVYVRCEDYDETPEEAFVYFGISGKPNASFDRGEEVFDSCDCPVLVSVNKAIIFDFMKNRKTDFEIAVFCAFCGLRSIIGTKPYAKTNNSHLLARMFGCRSIAEFEALEPYYIDNFCTAQQIRYQLTEKIIKNELVLKWGLKYYSNQSKGFYVSFKLGFDALVLHAEKSRKSNQLRQQQAEQRQIIEQIKKQVRGR